MPTSFGRETFAVKVGKADKFILKEQDMRNSFG
jgi:hypothetical protein